MHVHIACSIPIATPTSHFPLTLSLPHTTALPSLLRHTTHHNTLPSHTPPQFIYDAAAEHCVDIATHRHGCCVLQRCIDYATNVQKKALIKRIADHSLMLSQVRADAPAGPRGAGLARWHAGTRSCRAARGPALPRLRPPAPC